MRGRAKQIPPLGRQRHALSGTGEQLLARQLLQPLDLLADGALRPVEMTRGAGHAAGLGNRQKGPDDADVHIPLHGVTY